MNSQEINKLKLVIEAKASKAIFNVLKEQSNDAVKFFLADKSTIDIANNYLPEMLKVIRDAMRASIAIFGSSMRKSIEKEFDIEFKQIDNSNFDDINKQLDLDFAIFIANESENQAKLITSTSSNVITNTIKTQTEIKMNEVSDLIREQNQLRLIDTPQAKKRVATIELIVRNAKRDVAKNIRVNLLQGSISRARLIGEQVVGTAEAYSRNRESEVMNGNIKTDKGTLEISKTWVAILDSKTRDSHASADGQSVDTNQPFIVNGESLQYPRDPNGSAENIVRCRCVAVYNKKYI